MAIQKKAIRIINGAKYLAHTEPLFRKSNLLKFTDIYSIALIKFYYKFINGTLPHYFTQFEFSTQADIHEHNTRFNYKLKLPIAKSSFQRRTLHYRVAEAVNYVEINVFDKVNSLRYHGFVQNLKRSFLKSYKEVVCSGCYACSH